jgi:hypothetical protein
MPKEVVVAILGVISSALVAWFVARASWRLELQKWRRTRDDAHTSDLRAGLQQLILTISSAAHSMCWLTWLADADASKLTKERVIQYDAEMHKVLPQLLGSHALVASLRPQTYRRFKDLIDEIFDVDRAIGNACLKFVPGVPATAEELKALHARATKIEDKLPETVRSVLRDITRPDEAEFFS